jgi:ferredoxin
MRLEVSGSQCMGHGQCQATSPAYYELDDNGFNVLAGQGVIAVPDDQQAAALRGSQSCPERAISILPD